MDLFFDSNMAANPLLKTVRGETRLILLFLLFRVL